MTYFFPPSSYEIVTPRVIIRNAIPSDAETMARILSSPENMPYQKCSTSIPIDEMERRLANWNKMASEGSNAFLTITLRETGEPIGFGGFNCFEPQPGCADTLASEPSLGGCIDPQPRSADTPASGTSPYLTDIGVLLDRPLWRKGYATEILCASIDFAFTELKCQLIRHETDIKNEPWRALMQSMGFGDLEESGIVSFDNTTTGWIYKIDVETWDTAKTNLKARGKWPL
ncbi:hypothetical protein BGZ83_008083 [Gryganskiella cystojenkinii]|nr:hypothetical protein BGZ83_008083 [Gryganskiella cystojenkinii]